MQLIAADIHGIDAGRALQQKELREAAGAVWRRGTTTGDDSGLVAIRPVADQAADERHADRSGDNPAMVIRAG